jgi:hypothetical protein
MRTNAVQFHTGPLNACFKQKLAEVPDWFEITTVGDCQNEFKFTIKNLSPETWEFLYGGGSTTLSSGSTNTIDFAPYYADLFAISTADQGKHALVNCAYQPDTVPPRISCSTRVPPAA